MRDSYQDMAVMEPLDYRQHRELFANMAKRSRYFLVSPAKIDRTDETRGQVEIGHRYFEGAAAGAVMIGQAAEFRGLPKVVLLGRTPLSRNSARRLRTPWTC